MKFERRFSKAGTPVAKQIEWKTVTAVISHKTGETMQAEVPSQWSQNAADILVSKYFRKAGVPTETESIVNDGTIPQWLSPSRPTIHAVFQGETSARQVFDRLAGAWTYWGWRSGVFGSVELVEETDRWLDPAEENARIFYDELFMMLARQIGAPNSPQWFNTGLHWAYGIEGPASGQWAIDYDTRAPSPPGAERIKNSSDCIYETANSYEHPQPHACFIQPVKDDLVNEGGIMDLTTREVRLFKHGSGTGTNFSSIRAKGEKLSGGGVSSGLMSFLRIGDRAAGAVKSGGTTRRAAKMVIVDADHPEIEDLIDWKVKEEAKVAAMHVGSKLIRDALQGGASSEWASQNIPSQVLDRAEIAGFIPEEIPVDMEGEGYDTVSGQNSNNSVRLTNGFMKKVDTDSQFPLIRRTDGTVAKLVNARELWQKICRATWAAGDPGLQFDDNINEWHTCPNDGRINASNPCSEYMFLDNTACNLASLNLVLFMREDGTFDIDAFIHAVRLWTVTLDISVTMASFPSKEIALGSYNYRTLGLGYANLGGLLMRLALPYDSDEGRALAAAITALMHFVSLKTSNEMAKDLGPFPRWEANREPMYEVLLKHYTELLNHKFRGNERPIMDAAVAAWKEIDLADGFRNAQVTLLAPTGTISFVMDCDTTGLEPDFALVKHKNLAGGGTMKIVNQSVIHALKKLGYDDHDSVGITNYIALKGNVKGSVLRPEHASVFDCANEIRPMAHVEMMAAVQPFLSGAISKTVNLPNNATIEDVSQVYRRAWEMGIKAIAPYRDGSKLSQPLSASKPVAPLNRNDYVGTGEVKTPKYYRFAHADKLPPLDPISIPQLDRGQRELLPPRRKGYTQKARVEGSALYLRTGEYEDGRLGEIFVTLSREGSTLRSVMECFAKAVSLGMQYGVPAEEYIEAFINTKFEPAGPVQDHENVKMCSSIIDLIFRDLAIYYGGRDDLAHIPRAVNKEPTVQITDGFGNTRMSQVGAAVSPRMTGKLCPECGAPMTQTGTCMTCPQCGFNEGCA